jgi:hypothetical protein
MFGKQYESDNKKFCLYVTIKCTGKKKFRAWAEDFGKKNSKYADREVVVDGSRRIRFSFPVSPKSLFIGVLNSDNPKDADFTVELMEGALINYNIWVDSDTEKFIKLALHFIQVCGFEPASQNGRLFQTDDSEFNIRFFDVIRDMPSGKVLNTPARIGHKTGIIETAKAKFDTYTIPMRMIILLHEFSHKYKNPKIGLEISNEVGADVNALYIYLGLGFSKIDAICVFANVFLKAQTKGNIDRMRKIMDYTQKFENQEFAELN